MKKVRFEELENLEEIIEVCRKKNRGVINSTWLEIVKQYSLPVKPEALSRFAKYIGIYEEYAQKHEGEDFEEQLLELKKEKMKVASQRRELNRSLREQSNMENLLDTLKELWEEEEEVQIFQEPINYSKNNTREGVLTISDVHYGIVVDNELNVYSPSVCIESFEKLYNKTLENIKMYNLSKLHILLAGDLVSGIIHTNLRLQQGEDVIKQIKGVAGILANFIGNMSKVIDIEVHYTTGNHSRVMQDKKQNLSSENFEHLIPWYITAKTGIKIMENNSDVVVFNVCGYNIASLHGHQTTPQKSYEYIIKRTQKIPDAILIAHYHNDSRIDSGCPVITNGSMVGVDEYALESGYCSTPHQKLIIFEANEGEIATVKINFIRK